MSESPKTGSSAETDELQRLRQLLLGDKIQSVDALYRRVNDPEERTEDVAEVLPGAMDRVIADPVTQPKIERPIVETIRGAIKRDTESFAEALFPVLGPAIRRAVADALKSLVQRINAALEHSFTVKGLRWRLEAARSGVPFAQIVLRETMLYAVQEVFLIQSESGLIMAKARREDTLALDEDAFSAMLTAIQAFICDSLGVSTDERLRGAELGDRTLWVIDGPQAVLACLVVGSPPLEVRERLRDTLELLHAKYGNELELPPEQFSGLPGVEMLLEETLLGEVADGKTRTGASRARLLWGTAAVLLLAVLGWGIWHTWQFHQQEEAIARLFEAETGYALTSHDDEAGKLHFYGLRDPLSTPPESVLQNAGYDPDGMTLVFRPYQSLEDEMVMRRLRRFLGGGDRLHLELEDTVLSVRGTLTASQHSALEVLPGLHPVIASVDLSGVRLDPAEAAALARRQLNAPDDVIIKPANGRLEVSGGDAEWFSSASQHGSPVGGWAVDFTPMREGLENRLDTLEQRIEGRTLRFTRLYEVSAESSGVLDSLAGEMRQMLETASALNTEVSLRLEGFADGLGTPERNREIALGRARVIQDELARRGVESLAVNVTAGSWQSGREDPELRYVIVHVDRKIGP